MKRKVAYTLIISLFAACNSAEKVKVEIDNPTVSNIEVNIEGKAYPIAAEGMQVVELAIGEHQFETKLEQSSLKGSFNVQKEGLLNATGSEYVIWNDLALADEVTPEEADAIYYSVLKDDTIVLEGVKYIAEVKKCEKDQYFIPKNWEFNVITPFPLKPKVNNRYKTQKKIFRKMAFIEEYNERYALDEKEIQRFTDSVLNVMDEQAQKGK